MIILYIRGGLGNQLSQIAYAYILSKKCNKNLYIDTSSYRKYKIRSYSVSNLAIEKYIDYIENSGISKFQYKLLVCERKTYHLFEKIHGIIKGEVGSKIFGFLAKQGRYYNFDSTYYGYPDCSKSVIDVYGYFLAERYFSDNRSLLIDLFSVTTKMTEDEKEYYSMIQNANAVAISMRLQDDYVNNIENNVCDVNYFVRGIKYIKEHVDNPTFFIFADDIERAKKLNLGLSATYISNMSDYQSLRLLYSCKHYIISNSSFSWWGAYLSRNNSRIIVSPSKWMNTEKNDYADKYYKGMVRL